jgi:tRNA(fMet)-specific endonuclease VapC
MNLLLDTNILLFLIKDPSLQLLTNIINPDEKRVLISVVSVAEIKSIALQNNWGLRNLQSMDIILNKVSIIDINQNLVNTYVEIDAYSQRRNPKYTNYSFSTPRNMGKNDLWIASTAALLGLKLVTTDNDFNHLHQVFIEVQNIKPEIFKG